MKWKFPCKKITAKQNLFFLHWKDQDSFNSLVKHNKNSKILLRDTNYSHKIPKTYLFFCISKNFQVKKCKIRITNWLYQKYSMFGLNFTQSLKIIRKPNSCGLQTNRKSALQCPLKMLKTSILSIISIKYIQSQVKIRPRGFLRKCKIISWLKLLTSQEQVAVSVCSWGQELWPWQW